MTFLFTDVEGSGERAFEEAREAGTALKTDQAIALALGEHPPDP